jgi:hypothetical protein
MGVESKSLEQTFGPVGGRLGACLGCPPAALAKSCSGNASRRMCQGDSLRRPSLIACRRVPNSVECRSCARLAAAPSEGAPTLAGAMATKAQSTAPEASAEPAQLTNQAVTAAYLATMMDAAAHGHGFDHAALKADAFAAQRGDPAARRRLFSVFRPRRCLPGPPRLRAPRRPIRATGRPRRVAACRSHARARSPSRDGPEPPADEPPLAPTRPTRVAAARRAPSGRLPLLPSASALRRGTAS